ncbi:hypothetical protein IAT38_002819 [Cryptococcus sp. DSM 104549]
MGRRRSAMWLAAVLLVLAAMRVSAAVTGQRYCNKYMCVTGKHDSSRNIDEYTLDPPSGKAITRDDFGWIAIGFGSTMTSSPMVIAWPNSDGSITLSQRSASQHTMPTVVSSPPRKASLISSSSFSNSSTTSITFTLPASSNTTNSTAIIWAYGNTNPDSSSEDAKITQHLASGNTKLALLGVLSNSTNTTISSGDSGSSDDGTTTSSSHKILVAHVVCGALAAMAVLPTGMLVPRIARGMTTSRWWFPVHGVLNGILGFGLVTAAFAIARANFDGGFNSSHRKLGLALFVLCLLQTLLGIFVHWYQRAHRFQTAAGRGPTNFLHMMLGVFIIGIGWGTVWKGIDEEWGLYSGTGNPSTGWKAGWGVLVALFSLAYLAGFYLLPRQMSNERKRRDWASSLGHHPSQSAPPPPPPGKRASAFSFGMGGNSSGSSSNKDIGLQNLPPPPPPAHPARRVPPPIPGNRPTGY